jgi:molecular chaperone DnaK (HSP70)
VEHAFDDLASRRWIEAKLKAQETVKATRAGLEQYGGEISKAQRIAIEEGLREVEGALATEDAGSESGDLQRLKKEHAALDEATKPLADLMMDRAMEAMLRKRGLIA